MKKIVSLVLALSMVLSMFATVFAASLSDITGTKYEAAVEALVELGVVNGYPTGDYKPENEVNRAELAKMIVICMGLEEDADRAQYQTSFADDSLTEGGNFAWARGYVNAAAAAGVIKGYPDGTFGPERTVTYAEAVTMMLRALGYGNVMEAEGTWPTNAMMKAKELEMFDDVEFNSSNDGATRGDVAILLWNMLRTPMWKITSENQGTGMTSEMEKIMLNVKFPKYAYVEDYYLVRVDVEDGEATAEIVGIDEDGEDVEEIEGTLTSGDLARMIPGMKVSALYNRKTEEFLTLACNDTLVEGYAEEAKKAGYDVRIADKDYRLPVEEEEEEEEEESTLATDGTQYVVALIDGKDVLNYVVLSGEAKIIKEGKLKSTINKLNEEAIVIIDGVWATVEDLEEGDVYTTQISEEFADEDVIYVARERVEGTFESLTDEKDEDDARVYIEVDGEVYEAIADALVINEEVNGKSKDVTETIVPELVKKDNKYLDQDVELVFNSIGEVVEMNFGEVSEAEGEAKFFVVTSNGVWYESTKKGFNYYIELANADGEDTYQIKGIDDLLAEADIPASLVVGETAVYYAYMADEEEPLPPVFLYAEVDEDGETITVEEDNILPMTELFGIMEEPVEIGDYTIEYFDEEMTEKNKINDMKVKDSTIVYVATPELDKNDKCTGVNLEVLEGPDALEGVEEGYIAYKTGKTSIAYAFVWEDAKSQDLLYGKVTAATERAGHIYMTIGGEKYEVDEDEIEAPWFAEVEGEETALELAKLYIGAGVAFTEDDGVATIKDAFEGKELADSLVAIVEKVDDDDDTCEVTFLLPDDTTKAEAIAAKLDLEVADGRLVVDILDEDIIDELDDITFVLATIDYEKNTDGEFEIVIDDIDEVVKGLEEVDFEEGDRIVITLEGEKVKAIIVANGLAFTDEVDADGIVTLDTRVVEVN